MSNTGVLNNSNLDFKVSGNTVARLTATTNTITLQGQFTTSQLTLNMNDNASGSTGDLILQTGSSSGGNGDGGDIILEPGTGNGSGTNGIVYIQSNLEATGTILTENAFILQDNISANTVTIEPSTNTSGSYTLVLPIDDGNNGQFLQTDGFGVLSWADSSTSAAGSQYEFIQTEITSDTTVPANGSAVPFDNTVNSDGSISFTTSTSTFTLDADNIYKLTAILKLKTTSSIVEFQWYDTTATTVTLGLPAIAIPVNHPNTVSASEQAVAFIKPSVSTDVQVLINNGGSSSTLDSDFCQATIELVAGATTSPSSNPGGSNTQVQFNDNGSFAGSPNFTFNGSTVSIGTSSGLADLNLANGQLIISHDGTNSSFTNSSTAGDLILSNEDQTNDIIVRLGTSDTNTSFLINTSNNVSRLEMQAGGAFFLNNLNVGSGNTLAINSGEVVDSISLRKFKTNEMEAKFEKNYSVGNILKLKPKFFDWKNKGERDFGLVVEDAIDEHLFEFLYFDPKSGPKNFKDRALIAGIIAYLKDQHKSIVQLQKEINRLKHENRIKRNK